MLKNSARVVLLLALFTLIGVVFVQAQEAETTGHWWNDRVFYEIFVRSFYDSDGDGIGDLQGVIQKLDYLNDGDPETTTDLGITGIWLMPVAESPSYHGYDVTDYGAIESDYGTAEDFRQLMDEAHERGIAIIVDLVTNHTSREHPWFEASREGDPEYADWYVWADENPGYTGPWGQKVWIPAEGQFYYAVFWEGMPDLNYTNPEVATEIEDVARFWLEDLSVDGFRMDAVKHLVENGRLQENTAETHVILKAFNAAVKTSNPDALIVGEAWTSTSQAVKYIDNEMDMVFEFDLAASFVRTASLGTVSSVRNAQNDVLENYPVGSYAAFITNHDQNRVMSQLGGDVAKAKMAAVLLLTNPGVPFIYYGEEIGMSGIKPDEDIRTPMQWDDTPDNAGFSTADRLWRNPNPGYVDFNVAEQTSDPNSLLSVYRELIALRNGHSALRNGDMQMVSADARKTYAYIRQNEEETLLVVMNFDDEPVENLLLTLESGTLGDISSAELLYGIGEITPPTVNAIGGFDAYTPVSWIPPLSAMIIKLS